MARVEQPAPGAATRQGWSPPAALTLTVATLGFALNLRAWLQFGPQLWDRFGAQTPALPALVGVSLVVGALVRLPAGTLTDRYGARVVFPVVSLAAAASTVGLSLVDPLPLVTLLGCAAATGSAAFVVGAALVSRTVPYARRGLAVGAFTAGSVGTAGIAAVSRLADPDGRLAPLVLGGLLAGHALLSAAVLRDRGAGPQAAPPLRACAETLRAAARTSLTPLYALALGGVVATPVYLPLHLLDAYRMPVPTVLWTTVALVGLAAAGRVVGAWWTDLHGSVRLLAGCFGAAAALCVVPALAPPGRLALTAMAGIAVCDGLASGALLALVCKSARADRVGALVGMTGAAGALGGLLIPLLLVVTGGVGHSPAVAWLLLAATLVGAAAYVRVNGLRIGLGLAVSGEPADRQPATSIVVVGDVASDLGAAAVVSSLAEMATHDELVVVYGPRTPARRLSPNSLVTAVRDQLPRHSVSAVRVDSDAGSLPFNAVVVGEYLQAGKVAVVLTAAPDLTTVSATLASYLHADRVLRLSYTPAGGPDLRQMWARGPAAAV